MPHPLGEARGRGGALPPAGGPGGLAGHRAVRCGRLATPLEPPVPGARRRAPRDGRRREAGDETRSGVADRERHPGPRGLARPRRGRPRPGGRGAPEDPAAEVGARARPPAGPRLGPVRTGRRHVPGDPPRRGGRPRLMGLRRDAAREGREGPRRADPGGRPHVPRRRAPHGRPVPRPGGPAVNLPDRTVLGNGAVLVSYALPSNPFIAFRGSVPAGVAAEGPDPGVPGFTSQLLLSGTRRMSAAKLADRLEGIGATLEFHNGEELLSFRGRCTRETAAETVRILVECLSQPTFPPKEIERVRGELLNDLRIEADDTRAPAFRQVSRLVFPKDHPYGRDPKGGEARVRRG